MKETTRLTVKALRSEASRLGAILEGGPIGRWVRYNVEAPAGKVWAGSGTHVLLVEWRNGDAVYRAEAIEDALERMADEVVACDDPECDYCHPEEE